MKSVNNKEELEEAIRKGETKVQVTDKNLVKALVVVSWIKENPVKGTLLASVLPAVAIGATVVVPVAGIVGVGIASASVTISAAEIVALAVLIVAIIGVCKGRNIHIDKDGNLEIK